MSKTNNSSKQSDVHTKEETTNLDQKMIFNNLGLESGMQPMPEDDEESAETEKQGVQGTKSVFNNMMPVESDQELHRGDTDSLLEHNLHYTALLKAYVDDFKWNSYKKMQNKQTLFYIAVGMLISVPIVSFLLIIGTLICMAFGTITVLESLPGVLAALTTILGTFMMIPKMITKYLFNKKEEEHLSDIIGKIQEYDKDIRERL